MILLFYRNLFAGTVALWSWYVLETAILKLSCLSSLCDLVEAYESYSDFSEASFEVEKTNLLLGPYSATFFNMFPSFNLAENLRRYLSRPALHSDRK